MVKGSSVHYKPRLVTCEKIQAVNCGKMYILNARKWHCESHNDPCTETLPKHETNMHCSWGVSIHLLPETLEKAVDKAKSMGLKRSKMRYDETQS